MDAVHCRMPLLSTEYMLRICSWPAYYITPYFCMPQVQDIMYILYAPNFVLELIAELWGEMGVAVINVAISLAVVFSCSLVAQGLNG